MSTRWDNSNVIWSKRAPPCAADRFSALLLQIVDGGLAGVLFLVPFLMGGRHAFGQLILVVLAAVIALAWALRQSLRANAAWRPTWALFLLVAAAALVSLQAVPLPQTMLERLAPEQAKVLTFWSAAQPSSPSLGRWPFVSYTPADTTSGLVLFMAYGLLFFVTLQRLEEIQDIERLLRWCAASILCMALFGLVQYLVGNGKFFWFYDLPFSSTNRGAKGSFTNRNHFAHFLALGVGPLVWWLQHVSRRTRSHARKMPHPTGGGAHRGELRTYLLGLALAIVLFTGLLSLSRGGMGALLLATAVAATACYWASAGAGRFLGTLLASALLIGAALSVFGLDQVGQRLETLAGSERPNDNWSGGRLAIWTVTAKAIPHYLALGAGVGSFREVYPIYADNTLDEGIVYTHAENSYLQVFLETGAIGGGLLLAGICMFGFWCVAGWKGPLRVKMCAAAVAASLIACLAQALVDFVWYVPACMAMMAVLAACALRLKQLAGNAPGRDQVLPMRRWAAVAVTILFIPIGAWMVYNCLGPSVAAHYWDQYLLAQPGALLTPPSSYNQVPATDQNAADSPVETEQKTIDCLEKVIFWQPTHYRAQLALAEAHLRLFNQYQSSSKNPLPLVNIRDAALDSQFPSREALCAWLARALGAHWVHLDASLRHARQALRLCPLQGRAYICLAKLCFLDKAQNPAKQACVDQALRVRPCDGAVVYAAAAEALLAGNTPRWLELSQHIFRCSREYQRQLIGELVNHTPPEETQTMIELIVNNFQPDLQALQILHDVCAKRCRAEQLIPLCRYWVQKTEAEAHGRNDPQVVALWMQAQRLYAQLDDGQRALACARRALECDPNDYNVHYQLALCLLEQKQYAEAESELHWCLQRNSRDKSLEVKLKEALKGRLDAQRAAAAVRSDNF
jgi:O-antigen ligase